MFLEPHLFIVSGLLCWVFNSIFRYLWEGIGKICMYINIYIYDYWLAPLPLGLGNASPRTICLIIMITALGGSWVLEQPGLSAAEYYPWFRDTLTALYESQLGSAVS